MTIWQFPKNTAIVEKAESNGIYMLNIMAGSSHWFQVHDQLPFAILKKKMRDCFYKCFGVSSTQPGPTLETRMAEFYESEKYAFDPKVVRRSFALVGLHPLDKTLILKNCQENCPVVPESDEGSMIDDLAQKIVMYSEKKRSEIESLRATVKRAEVTTTEKPQRRGRPKKDCPKKQVKGCKRGADTSHDEIMSDASEKPKKRAKPMRV